MAIDYDHALNTHSLDGPQHVFANLFPGALPSSVLDVGCGIGTWLRAALDAGVPDVLGIDGINIPSDKLLIPAASFTVRDLTKPIDLGRRFDLVICLEVAEHLEFEQAEVLIRTLNLH
jgi:2-polyprenyl-3-methyl-5-hydroxy-6-metoxy-1,4-benzoquinol methylase